MKKRLTVSLDENLIEDIRDAVVWLQSKGERLTLSEYIAIAVRAKMAVDRAHYKAKRIPKRKRELSRGRLIQ